MHTFVVSFRFSDSTLANILSPQSDACGTKFELKVDEVLFVGHPTLACERHDKEFKVIPATDLWPVNSARLPKVEYQVQQDDSSPQPHESQTGTCADFVNIRTSHLLFINGESCVDECRYLY